VVLQATTMIGGVFGRPSFLMSLKAAGEVPPRKVFYLDELLLLSVAREVRGS
jgi:hypothetical protein